MKQFKRVTALSLLLAMVLGLFGGIPADACRYCFDEAEG